MCSQEWYKEPPTVSVQFVILSSITFQEDGWSAFCFSLDPNPDHSNREVLMQNSNIPAVGHWKTKFPAPIQWENLGFSAVRIVYILMRCLNKQSYRGLGLCVSVSVHSLTASFCVMYPYKDSWGCTFKTMYVTLAKGTLTSTICTWHPYYAGIGCRSDGEPLAFHMLLDSPSAPAAWQAEHLEGYRLPNLW